MVIAIWWWCGREVWCGVVCGECNVVVMECGVVCGSEVW